MGIEINTIFTQMLVFLLLISIGAIGAKLRLLTDETLKSLSGFAMSFTIPALVFSTIVNSTDQATVFSNWYFLPLCFGIIGFLWVLGFLAVKACRLTGNRARSHLCQSTVGNLGMIGIPLLTALFGETCAVPLMLYLLSDQLLLWSVGIRLGYPKESASTHFSVKKFFSPVMIALLLGVVVLAFGLRFTGPVMETITGLGSTTRYISMIYIGGTIINGLSQALRSYSAFAIVLTKQLIAPMAVYCVLMLTGICGGTDAMCFALLAGIPSMGSLAIVARASGSDDQYASSSTVISTVSAIVTLPLVLFLIRLLPF